MLASMRSRSAAHLSAPLIQIRRTGEAGAPCPTIKSVAHDRFCIVGSLRFPYGLAWSPACERDLSCQVEPLPRSPHPLSSASRVSQLSQPTPSHIGEALELVALAFTTVVSIAVASTVEQPCAAGWR
jgi:hypothetical protein